MRQHNPRVRFPLPNHLKQLLPIQMHGRLAVADEADAALHEGADVEVVGEADVDARDAAAAVVLDGRDHLVDDFARVGFGPDEHFEIMRPPLGVFAGYAFQRDVWAAVFHLLEFGCDGRAAG